MSLGVPQKGKNRKHPHPPPPPVCLPVSLSSLVIFLFLLCLRAGPPWIDPKWSRHASFSMVGGVVPALASFSSRPCGLVREWSPLLVDREHHYLIVEHFTRMVIPTSGYFLVLASRLTNESMAYRWAITSTWPPSFSFLWLRLECWPWSTSATPHLRPPSRPVFADGGRLCGHSHRPLRSIYLLPRVPRSPTASLGPRNTYTLRVSRLVRLLLGAPFPVPSLSCFSL